MKRFHGGICPRRHFKGRGIYLAIYTLLKIAMGGSDETASCCDEMTFTTGPSVSDGRGVPCVRGFASTLWLRFFIK